MLLSHATVLRVLLCTVTIVKVSVNTVLQAKDIAASVLLVLWAVIVHMPRNNTSELFQNQNERASGFLSLQNDPSSTLDVSSQAV